jgi:hypothetical protein
MIPQWLNCESDSDEMIPRCNTRMLCYFQSVMVQRNYFSEATSRTAYVHLRVLLCLCSDVYLIGKDFDVLSVRRCVGRRG